MCYPSQCLLELTSIWVDSSLTAGLSVGYAGRFICIALCCATDVASSIVPRAGGEMLLQYRKPTWLKCRTVPLVAATDIAIFILDASMLAIKFPVCPACAFNEALLDHVVVVLVCILYFQKRRLSVNFS